MYCHLMLQVAASPKSNKAVAARASRAAAACRNLKFNSAGTSEAATLVEQLMEVAHELGAMKQAKVAREAIVPVAKARLEWINRDNAQRLAERSGWTGDVQSDLQSTEIVLAREYDNELAAHATPLLIIPGDYKALRFLRHLPDETVVLNSASRAPFMVRLFFFLFLSAGYILYSKMKFTVNVGCCRVSGDSVK